MTEHMLQEARRLRLIRMLLEEEPQYQNFKIPQEADAQKRLLRSLMNVRPPRPAGEAFLRLQDAYLQEEIAERGITDIADLTPVEDGIYLWQGDITALRCGAIVNAANSGMTGCYVPCHGCIDNAIHTYAGVQLRLECARQMAEQGEPEPTGRARITPAYNLPCRYILHTVGPIVHGALRAQERELLASCYRSCLALAREHRVESVAFCCISTGEFHFPPAQAAEIAVRTVRQCRGDIRVILNVFRDSDFAIYRTLLGAGQAGEEKG